MTPVEVQIESRNGAQAPFGWSCPECGALTERGEWRARLCVCPACGHHARVGARDRIAQLADPGSFAEEWSHIRTLDPLQFADLEAYPERTRGAQAATGLTEAIVAGRARIENVACVLAVMDFGFMGGSMGSVVGERFFRAAEAAVADGVPLVAVCSSGGARMQEGVLSLMQMAKTTLAVDMLNETRTPYVAVLVDPCTGGVVASFATLADICIAEPAARLYFSGPRVIKETTREELPEGFSSAERNMVLGHLDAVVPRAELRGRLASYLRLLRGGARDDGSGQAGDAWWGATDVGRRVVGETRRAALRARRRVGGARRLVEKAARRAQEMVSPPGGEPQ
ncbi:MAG: acetyl-CoA carboxylase carboxyl transferase subunit beta [Actinobacteria bacterium]|nr:acetyl-CoA carboxylase carboxyl transferase subunit beta [Actinomycetota bacterium]